MILKLAALLLLELCYIVARQLWMTFHEGGLIAGEWGLSAIRAASVVVVMLLFSEDISKYKLRLPKVKAGSPWVLVACGFFLLVPVLAGNWGLPTEARPVFALTSLVVGLREELVYRALLQGWLTHRCGLIAALGISNALFIPYHIGVAPLTWVSASEYFLAGTFLGLVFHATGRLWLVVVLHAVYDAIYCYTPLMEQPLARAWLPALLAPAVIIGVWIVWRSRSASCNEG